MHYPPNLRTCSRNANTIELCEALMAKLKAIRTWFFGKMNIVWHRTPPNTCFPYQHRGRLWKTWICLFPGINCRFSPTKRPNFDQKQGGLRRISILLTKSIVYSVIAWFTTKSWSFEKKRNCYSQNAYIIFSKRHISDSQYANAGVTESPYSAGLNFRIFLPGMGYYA